MNSSEPVELDPAESQQQPKKKNFWKSVGNFAKQLLGARTETDADRYYGEDPAYNDGSEPLPYGRFSPEIIRRFRMGNENGSAVSNEQFIDGFDDPAHLTFKVEFGEWGASILTEDEVRSKQQSTGNGTSNLNYTDYDEMPMGLLDLNFSGAEYAGIAQTSYNAQRYLMNRNEDRRAQYIKDFVQGLYTIQRDMPYLFKSINGLDKLTDFDAARGQRLKDVTLRLTCINEGIDRKIKTLLELYRKAAWDDVYQRYALPDIMRYFKMIVYVFEARSVQMGNGEFSPD